MREMMFPKFSGDGLDVAGGNMTISLGSVGAPPETFVSLGPGRTVCWLDGPAVLYLARATTTRRGKVLRNTGGFGYYRAKVVAGAWKVGPLERADLGINWAASCGNRFVLVTNLGGTPSIVTDENRTWYRLQRRGRRRLRLRHRADARTRLRGPVVSDRRRERR